MALNGLAATQDQKAEKSIFNEVMTQEKISAWMS